MSGGGRDRNVSHQITPHANSRLPSTMSEPKICANNPPVVCVYVYSCDCVWAPPPTVCKVFIMHPATVLLNMFLSKVSPPGFLLIPKCFYIYSDGCGAVTQFPRQLRAMFGVTVGRLCSASRTGVVWCGRKNKAPIVKKHDAAVFSHQINKYSLVLNCCDEVVILAPNCCSSYSNTNINYCKTASWVWAWMCCKLKTNVSS